MKNLKMICLVVCLMFTIPAYSANHDPAAIVPLMPNARISLIDGIQRAEAASGIATSAKFEVADDGRLVLSVYTVPEGLAIEPEARRLYRECGFTDGESEFSSLDLRNPDCRPDFGAS